MFLERPERFILIFIGVLTLRPKDPTCLLGLIWLRQYTRVDVVFDDRGLDLHPNPNENSCSNIGAK